MAVLTLGMACGGPKPDVQSPPPAASVADAGTSAPDATIERPFAKTTIEAQILIQEQISGRMKELWKCVDAYRTAKAELHRPLVVDVGIDQEGHLLGVTAASSKEGDLDPTTKKCLWDGLHGLLFPRSHAGIITVRESFTDTSVAP